MAKASIYDAEDQVLIVLRDSISHCLTVRSIEEEIIYFMLMKLRPVTRSLWPWSSYLNWIAEPFC